MTVVTGASGKLGRRIVEELLERLPADHIGAATRDPGKVRDLEARGVRVRRADFTEPSSLDTAFEGASQLLIISSNAQAQGGDAVAQHRGAIDAALAAGVRRIVYTSHMGASASSAFSPMHSHAATEVMLREAGIAWTALRNGFYTETIPMIVGGSAASGVLASSPDGKVAWTTRDDLAEAAARILAEEGSFDGLTPPLTASAALDLAGVAAILSDLHECEIRHRVVGEDDYAGMLSAGGAPSAIIGIMLGMFRAARAGEFSMVDPTLGRLLGREPTRTGDVLAAQMALPPG